MAALATIFDYLRVYAPDLGKRITEAYQPLHKPEDPLDPLLSKLRRKALPAQALAIMGTVKFWKKGGRAARWLPNAAAENPDGDCFLLRPCGRQRFTAFVMCPPHLPKKWAREVFIPCPTFACSSSTTCATTATSEAARHDGSRLRKRQDR